MKKKLLSARTKLANSLKPSQLQASDISSLRTQRLGIYTTQDAEDFALKVTDSVSTYEKQRELRDVTAWAIIAIAIVLAVLGIVVAIILWGLGSEWTSGS